MSLVVGVRACVCECVHHCIIKSACAYERERGFVTNRRTYAERKPKPKISMGSCILYALIMYIYFIVCAPQPRVFRNYITFFCVLCCTGTDVHPFPLFTTPHRRSLHIVWLLSMCIVRLKWQILKLWFYSLSACLGCSFYYMCLLLLLLLFVLIILINFHILNLTPCTLRHSSHWQCH